jgi:hypothetical protein
MDHFVDLVVDMASSLTFAKPPDAIKSSGIKNRLCPKPFKADNPHNE